MTLSARPDDLSDMIARELPYLRRFARALTGTQEQGDAYVAATLEAIIADPSGIDADGGLRVSLFRLFDRIWSTSGGAIEDGLPPEAAGPEAAGPETASPEAVTQRRLAPLTPRSRQALLLKALEEFDLRDIARVMSVSEEEAAILVSDGARQVASQTRGRILIIEDEPIIAMDIEGIVTSLGHTVTSIANTRTSAVAAAATDRPDLVLADIQLADGSSGIDAVRDILGSITVPVIFITAYPERLLTGERPEPTFLIAKPFKDEQVAAAIGQALFFGAVATPRPNA